MHIQDQIRQLQDPELSTVELQTLLNTFHAHGVANFKDADALLLTSILLTRTIPQTYLLLDGNTQNVLYQLLANKVGVSHLIKTIITSSTSLTSVKPNDLFLLIDTLLNLLQRHLSQLLTSFTNSPLKEQNAIWKPLLTMKISDCLGAILIWLFDHTCPYDSIIIDRNRIRLVHDTFVTDLLEGMITLPSNVPAVLSIITFHFNKEPMQTFNVIKDHWNECLELFNTQSHQTSTKQKYLIAEEQTKFILGLYALTKHLVKDKDSKSSQLYFQIVIRTLQKMNPYPSGIREKILTQCSNESNLPTIYIWLKAFANIDLSYTRAKLEKFGNVEYITNTSIRLQQNYTIFIIVLLMNIKNDEEIVKLSSDKSFLECITHRLESKSTSIRELGMFVADYVYERNNGSAMFDIPSYNIDKKQFMSPITALFQEAPLLVIEDETMDSILRELLSNDKEKVSNEIIVKESTPLMVTVDMDYESDPDDSDLDDPSVARRASVAKPVFLKDLLHYFLTDPQKDKTAYDKRGIAFSIGIEMVRVKQGTPEMEYYSTKLVDAVLDLDDVGFPLRKDDAFNEDQMREAFNSWKVSFLIALCVSEPVVVTKYLLENFLKQDWSVPTRVQVLSSIGLSCRELCGKNDDFIWGKDGFDKVKAKQLPGPGHELFSLLDGSGGGDGAGVDKPKKIVDVEDEERERKLVDALEKTSISNGKVTFRSRKLDIDAHAAKLSASKTKYTGFINKKLPQTFYSLSSIWQEVNVLTCGMGFQVGFMSEYLNSHYLEILSMIYACGIPSCMQLVDMSVELINILIGQLRAIQISQSDQFPTLLLKSIIDSLKSLLKENDRTLSLLKEMIPMDLNALFEIYAQVLADAPPLEEPTNSISLLILQELQKCSFMYN